MNDMDFEYNYDGLMPGGSVYNEEYSLVCESFYIYSPHWNARDWKDVEEKANDIGEFLVFRGCEKVTYSFSAEFDSVIFDVEGLPYDMNSAVAEVRVAFGEEDFEILEFDETD